VQGVKTPGARIAADAAILEDHGLCVWAFDLLHHNGRDLRELPMLERKARIEKLIVCTSRA
jgi:ATP-dependent DNA ligase